MQNIKLSKVVGVLLLLQMAGGIFLNFSFLTIFKTDIFTVQHDDLKLALGVATILALGLSGINVLVAAIASQRFRHSNAVLCLLLVVFAASGLLATGFEYADLANYTAFIHDIRAQGLQELSPLHELMRLQVISTRNESHHLALFLSSLSLLLFYVVLYRTTHIAKLLLAFAIMACSLQLIALGNTFFQGQVIAAIQLPLFVTQLVMPIYFITVGFRAKASVAEVSDAGTATQNKAAGA
ncbi:MAG: hypothetical protein KKE30_18750 [Gammaproteobacteria bacterium]|nr:hypothetical protein [Gammaproteobacteria bacterium]MBU1553514.1 hypothetical protein [Gammaproteobacteria bacterium]MBU2069278.1 hypothetical protein [Gammaproteobacteria bacterium]MBU2183273.1 hypothetical protein [Gammaproteobacteria bacterium]MBU2204488.1 hypothetical protein [Gammaproteobacteria bacterium]